MTISEVSHNRHLFLSLMPLSAAAIAGYKSYSMLSEVPQVRDLIATCKSDLPQQGCAELFRRISMEGGADSYIAEYYHWEAAQLAHLCALLIIVSCILPCAYHDLRNRGRKHT